jgi:hypothetical protein
MKRTPLRRRAKLGAGKPLRRSLIAAANCVDGGHGRPARGGRWTLLHRVRERSPDRSGASDPALLGGCGDPLCVVPLCRQPCHRAYDRGELDLLPHLEPGSRPQLAHAVGHVGLIGALRRISGSRQDPADRRLA